VKQYLPTLEKFSEKKLKKKFLAFRQHQTLIHNFDLFPILSQKLSRRVVFLNCKHGKIFSLFFPEAKRNYMNFCCHGRFESSVQFWMVVDT
jgi:hypothetical protein